MTRLALRRGDRRQLTAQRLQLLDGATTRRGDYSPEGILITHGSQQMLYMVTEALCDPGDIVGNGTQP